MRLSRVSNSRVSAGRSQWPCRAPDAFVDRRGSSVGVAHQHRLPGAVADFPRLQHLHHAFVLDEVGGAQAVSMPASGHATGERQRRLQPRIEPAPGPEVQGVRCVSEQSAPGSASNLGDEARAVRKRAAERADTQQALLVDAEELQAFADRGPEFR
jgi:hypothetical protein